MRGTLFATFPLFWDEGSHPWRIGRDDLMRQNLDCIHQNRVKRGFADLPRHRPWSSANTYAGVGGLNQLDRDW